jgi:beta-hydroxylase
MTFSLAAKLSVLLVFIGSTLYVHLRGKARLPMLRQFVNHSALFAPYNALMYLFSAVPSKPYLDRSKFPELDVLKDNWEVIREEAMHLFDEGYIRAAEKNNDAGFGSFFKKGWKRFYLKWYDKPLPSAEALCPKTVALVSSIPNVNGRDVRAVAGRQSPQPRTATRLPVPCVITWGLSTPNSDDCRIFVDGQEYAWRDGEDVMFDETYVHWVKNETEKTRVILILRHRTPAEQSADDPHQPLGQRELQRQHAHADEVRAVDALEASAITAFTPSSIVPLAAQSRDEPVPYSLPAKITSGVPAAWYFIAAS